VLVTLTAAIAERRVTFMNQYTCKHADREIDMLHVLTGWRFNVCSEQIESVAIYVCPCCGKSCAAEADVFVSSENVAVE
jgi:hypothetical protein